MKKINIKTPSNIYLWWNFGSLISIFMIMQIFIGFMISMNYFIINNSFMSSFFIYYNINFGWLMRLLHSNMTSLIFILIIFHLKRNLIYNTFFNIYMWMSGFMMMLIFMMISFLGYSLIWTQMSYWGMMVITNFISIIPFIGMKLMLWIWGNFNINMILINRFFILHYIFPLILILFIFIHINILHLNKSTNPLGLNNSLDLINLNPYSLIKDLIMYMMFLLLILNLIYFYPYLLNNYDNFNEMNYFVTPNHIEPEWYFLFFYSILRSIPNKFSGLLMMLFSLLMIFNLPMMIKSNKQNNKFNLFMMFFNFNFFFMLIFISILGAKIVEYPYSNINFIIIIIFFLNFMLLLI
uniref:cytochrome b n=1 Tax=Phenacoccus manihoti TaxID=483259 RepID=UPI0021CCD0F8|nr:cytochrome b [Phenacoccus manihoti]UWM93463.1 cytochrome b [Phenacoccus manihoti]